jgi:hypothetical protein
MLFASAVLMLLVGGALLLTAAKARYYAARRYPCPACGNRRLRFQWLRSYPWVRSNPAGLSRYRCEGCLAAFQEAGGEWERVSDGGQ